MTQRKSPFTLKQRLTSFMDAEHLLEFVARPPRRHVPTILVAFQTCDSKYHVTALFRILTTDTLGYYLRVANLIGARLGWCTDVKLLESEATFSSHLYPEAKIMLVEMPHFRSWSYFHRLITGYPWQPHMTFKDGVVPENFIRNKIRLYFDVWIGMMELRPELKYLDLTPPGEKVIFGNQLESFGEAWRILKQSIQTADNSVFDKR